MKFGIEDLLLRSCCNPVFPADWDFKADGFQGEKVESLPRSYEIELHCVSVEIIATLVNRVEWEKDTENVQPVYEIHSVEWKD